jgi:hypothetical protein
MGVDGESDLFGSIYMIVEATIAVVISRDVR